MLIKFLGWNRVNPAHEVHREGDAIQCTKLQNYVCRNGKIKKIGGTSAYNSTSLGSLGVPLILRSYHIQADSTIAKRTHAYYDGTLYKGNDTSGEFLETNVTNLTKNCLPRFFSIQEADNSVVYLITGKDRLRKYNGNGSYLWDYAAGDLTTEVNYTDAVVHLDRAWYVGTLSSQLDYSDALSAETLADSIIVGSDKDSYNVRVVVGANETLYIFKNNSIYQLYGRTPSQFQLRMVTDKYGLATKRGIYPVGNGFVFINTFDKELYFFGGSESTIKALTENDIQLRDIINHTPQALENIDMTVADGLFRFAFQHKESQINHNNCELVYPIFEPDSRGLPKWSLIKGSNVWSYSVWDKYGDSELLTGRSEIGKVMYHNRGLNFDGSAATIETQVRTGEVVASEDMVVRFNGFIVKARPGSYNTRSTFRYFLNGRISDRGEDSLNLAGETRAVGLIHLQTQELLNDRIIPLTDYSRGNSIAFEIYDNNLDTELELYSIAFTASERYKIRNQYI